MILIPKKYQSPFLKHSPGPWAQQIFDDGGFVIGKEETDHGPLPLICERQGYGKVEKGHHYAASMVVECIANGQLLGASVEMLHYIEFDQRLEEWEWLVNVRHSGSEAPLTAVEFWQHTEQYLPEIARLCAPLSDEVLEDYEITGRDEESLAQGRKYFYGVDECDGKFGEWVMEWRTQLRHAALMKAYGVNLYVPRSAQAILLSATKPEGATVYGFGPALEIIEDLGFVVAERPVGSKSEWWTVTLTDAGREYVAALEAAGAAL